MPRRLTGSRRIVCRIGQDSPEHTWEHEERLMLYQSAAAQVRANCTPTVWAAFEQTKVRGRSVEVVAKELKISVGGVYASRSRILKRIRKAVHDSGFHGDI